MPNKKHKGNGFIMYSDFSSAQRKCVYLTHLSNFSRLLATEFDYS